MKGTSDCLDGFRCFLRVSRWQIQLVSLATVLIGPLFAADGFREIISMDVFLFGILFYSVVTFACNINCYYDVDVDSLRKVELADSVKYLGKKLVVAMFLEVFVAFFAVIMLILRGHFLVGVLGLTGLFLAYGYSAPLIRVKSKGAVSPLPVILGVYVLPPVAGHMIVDAGRNGPHELNAPGVGVTQNQRDTRRDTEPFDDFAVRHFQFHLKIGCDGNRPDIFVIRIVRPAQPLQIGAIGDK